MVKPTSVVLMALASRSRGVTCPCRNSVGGELNLSEFHSLNWSVMSIFSGSLGLVSFFGSSLQLEMAAAEARTSTSIICMKFRVIGIPPARHKRAKWFTVAYLHIKRQIGPKSCNGAVTKAQSI